MSQVSRNNQVSRKPVIRKSAEFIVISVYPERVWKYGGKGRYYEIQHQYGKINLRNFLPQGFYSIGIPSNGNSIPFEGDSVIISFTKVRVGYDGRAKLSSPKIEKIHRKSIKPVETTRKITFDGKNADFNFDGVRIVVGGEKFLIPRKLLVDRETGFEPRDIFNGLIDSSEGMVVELKVIKYDLDFKHQKGSVEVNVATEVLSLPEEFNQITLLQKHYNIIKKAKDEESFKKFISELSILRWKDIEARAKQLDIRVDKAKKWFKEALDEAFCKKYNRAYLSGIVSSLAPFEELIVTHYGFVFVTEKNYIWEVPEVSHATYVFDKRCKLPELLEAVAGKSRLSRTAIHSRKEKEDGTKNIREKLGYLGKSNHIEGHETKWLERVLKIMKRKVFKPFVWDGEFDLEAYIISGE